MARHKITQEDRDKHIRQARGRREAHIQKLDEREPTRQPFTSAQFIGIIHPDGLRFDRLGMLQVTISIPPDFVEEGLELRRAPGVPVSIDVQPWHPYLEAYPDEFMDSSVSEDGD